MSIVDFCKAFTFVYVAMSVVTFLGLLSRGMDVRNSLIVGMFWPYVLLESD